MKPFCKGNWGVLKKIENTYPLLFSPALLGIYLKETLMFVYKNACIVTEKNWRKKKTFLSQGSC